MIVLDASAAVDLLMASGSRSAQLADRVASVPELHVPELFDVEILSALRGLERAGKVAGGRIEAALKALEDIRAIRWRHQQLRPLIWRHRHRGSVYDATYVALARFLDLPLVTADSRLADSVGRDVAVELFVPVEA